MWISLASNHLKVMNSQKKFTGEDETQMFTKQIELSELNDLTVGQNINVICKVLDISSPQEINTNNNTLKLLLCIELSLKLLIVSCYA